MSGESGRSFSTAVSRTDVAQVVQAGSAMTPAARQKVVDKTITATIELLRGACLSGDTVSVRVTIQYINRIKSLTGVIVTLFRQGKMDTSPPPSLFTDATKEDSRRGDKPDMYSRSRTGLAGLSLSSTSSTSVFRKDLDQNAAPLIIDPATLQASVTVSVKVPDDAFPTIKGVPGEMISFKYQVEVVVDLGGRLASQLQGGQSSSRHGPYSNGGPDQGAALYGPRRAANIADTAQLRREKGVISVSMETVVGTTDSSRGRKPARRSPESKTVCITGSDDGEEAARNGSSPSRVRLDGPTPNGHLSTPPPDGYQFAPPPGHPPPRPSPLPPQHALLQPSQGPSQPAYPQENGYHEDAAPSYVPAPQVPDPAAMTEKERIRQAEVRLLPSRPWAAGDPAADEDDMYDAEDTPRLPRLEPNAPTCDNVEAGPSAPTEDKQELERRRLMSEASAPPEFPDDMERRGEGSSRDQAHDAEPSAPVLDDDDGGGGSGYPGYGAGAGDGPSRGGTRHAEQLPAYER